METKNVAESQQNAGGGHSLIKVTGGGGGGGGALRLLSRAVQQLKMLSRADTKSHF